MALTKHGQRIGGSVKTEIKSERLVSTQTNDDPAKWRLVVTCRGGYADVCTMRYLVDEATKRFNDVQRILKEMKELEAIKGC